MSIRFIREKKEGPPEKELKEALSGLFQTVSNVHKAYLAIADYGDGLPPKVALCVKADGTEDEDAELTGQIGDRFAQMFSSDDMLDVHFISDTQEAELINVCNPFYIHEKQSEYAT